MAQALEESALSTVPRALGLEDREPGSPTYGCFDRPYWHYRLSDFPSAKFATGALLLAQAHACPSSRFHGRARLADWARAGVAFLLSTMHRDGSLAEAYPFERSYCATAFATLHASLALEALGAPCPDALGGAARWLARARPTDAANQVAAAAAALAGVAAISRDASTAAEADRALDALLERQDGDGWFLEYGGADPGYQSVTLSCLAHLARLRPERGDAIEAAAARGAQALRHVVRADGTYEWRTTRRNTQYLYPHGLVRFAPDLAERFARGLELERVLVAARLDDRYFVHLAADFLAAAALAARREETP